jgi:hypothetical protein
MREIVGHDDFSLHLCHVGEEAGALRHIPRLDRVSQRDISVNSEMIDAVRYDTQNNNGYERRSWQTPVLRRSDASDAEASPGPSTDSGITTS